MDKVKIEPMSKAYRLLNPGLVVLVSVGDGIKDNLFAVGWLMPVHKIPGMVAFVSGQQHYSYPFIEKTGEFAINIPEISIVDAVYGCGTISGFDTQDKFALFGLTRKKAEVIKAPLVKESVAHLECRVHKLLMDEEALDDSTIIMAEIVTASVDPRHFRDGLWYFGSGLQLLHHVGSNCFIASNQVIMAKKTSLDSVKS